LKAPVRRSGVLCRDPFEIDDKPSLVVADNGPGFRDDPDSLIQPFFSRRPDGMGQGFTLLMKSQSSIKAAFFFRNEVT